MSHGAPSPRFVSVDSLGLDLLQLSTYYVDALMTSCGLDGCSAVCFGAAWLVSTLTKERGGKGKGGHITEGASQCTVREVRKVFQ